MKREDLSQLLFRKTPTASNFMGNLVLSNGSKNVQNGTQMALK